MLNDEQQETLHTKRLAAITLIEALYPTEEVPF